MSTPDLALPDETETFVRVTDLRGLFDIVCCSMDFGSGFLDTEQVDLVRRIAVVLGVDPMEATPSNVAKDYPHPFAAVEAVSEVRRDNPWCKRCYQTEDASCHATAEVGTAAMTDEQMPHAPAVAAPDGLAGSGEGERTSKASGGVLEPFGFRVGEQGCTMAMPSGEEIIATMRRILDALPRPAIYVHPDAMQRMREAIIRLPFGMPIPVVVENPVLPPDTAYYVEDTRVFKPEEA